MHPEGRMHALLSSGSKPNVVGGQNIGPRGECFSKPSLPSENFSHRSAAQLNQFSDLQIIPHSFFRGPTRQGAFYRKFQQGIARFALSTYSYKEQTVKLVLFDKREDAEPACTLEMEKIGAGMWFIAIKGARVAPGLLYNYWVNGRIVPDIYARALERVENCSLPIKSVLVDTRADWSLLLSRPLILNGQRRILELHVNDTRTFPDHWIPAGQAQYRGKQGTIAFLGCPAFLTYLKRHWGINTIQLMPIQFIGHYQGKHNYWGYDPVVNSALEPAYTFTKDPTKRHLEYLEARQQCHKFGIQLFLDIVLLHSFLPEDEWSAFAALNKEQYYHLDAQGRHVRIACSNSLRVDTPLGREYVERGRDFNLALADGLRIDQALALSYKSDGHGRHIMAPGPFLQNFPRGSFMIAEPNDETHCQPKEFGPKWHVWCFDHLWAGQCFFAGHSTYWDGSSIRQRYPAIITANSNLFHPGDRNRGVNIGGMHDGQNLWDSTQGMAEDYIRNHALPVLSPQAFLDLRFKMGAAKAGSVIFSPGDFQFSRGDFLLWSQGGEKNPYDMERHNQGLPFTFEDLPGQAPAALRRAFFKLMCGALALRKQVKIFDDDRLWDSKHLQWFDSDGRPMNPEKWRQKKNYLSCWYSNYRLPQELRLVIPTLLVIRHGASDSRIQLPYVGKNGGWKWMLWFNSEQRYVYKGNLTTEPGFYLPDVVLPKARLYEPGGEYFIKGPSVCLFGLVR